MTPKRFFTPWFLALAVCSCVGSASMAPAPATPGGSAAKPDWSQLEVRCRNFGYPITSGPHAGFSFSVDPQRCPLASAVRRLTDFGDLNRADLLSKYVRGFVDDLQATVGPVADFLTKAEGACGEGYQRACLAARLTKIQQKVAEAESSFAQEATVRAEIRQVAAATDCKQHTNAIDCVSNGPTEPMLAEADGHADAALAAAKAAAGSVSQERAQQDLARAQQDADKTVVADKTAVEECANDSAKCQADCKADPASERCWQLAVLITSGDPRVSKVGGNSMAFASRNCKAGNQRGCLVADKIDSQVTTQVNDAWSQVTDVGDDLVQKQHVVDVARKWGSAQPHLQRQLPMMLALNQKEVAERYCPAKKAFVGIFAQQAGAAEFQKRAAAHCKNETPHGEGISGADVTLTSECVAVYATPCP